MTIDVSTILQYALEYLRIGCEIGLLTFLIYYALLFVRGTRSATILAGIVILTILLSFLSRALGLAVLEWLVMQMWTFLALSVLIIFQPEIRRAFAELGSQQMRLRAQPRATQQRAVINTLLDATYSLANHRIGALIAVEQEIGMRSIAETGTEIQAPLSKELLMTFFYPNTPLHDGGVIVHDSEVVAAGCIFPLTDNPDLSQSLGTRHRAGVGITEETDAVAIIVSEETGSVSLAYKGRLVRGISRDRMERHLRNHLARPDRSKPRGLKANLAEIKANMSSTPEPDKESAST